MSLDDCISFANKNPVCAIATTEGNQPRVRYFLMWYADPTGFYFHTGTEKHVCRQLKGNPKTELCFYDFAPMEEGGGAMLRATGRAEFIDDAALRARLLEERPFLKGLGENVEEYLSIFRVTDGEAWFWTMADNLREGEIPRWKF